jgi:mono/diheme cytochrome c family protein
MKPLHLIALSVVLLGAAVQAAPGGDPAAGRSAWERQVPAGDGEPRSCVTCHGSDPRQPGKHARTGKPIAAMAPSVESERFSDPAKANKWFTRNCKWTWGRLCSADEQADIKAYLYSF